MALSDREKAELKRLIDTDQPLPARYKNLLFEDAREVELIWQGKTREVTNVVLPFQVIEQIDEPRSEGAGEPMGGLFEQDAQSGRQSGGWTNKLIWGDNKLVLSSLKNGPLRKEIEAAGGIKLIYIDPPFDVGADFSFELEIGDESFTKEPNTIEEIAYRDTWGLGTDSYLTMIAERLRLAIDLLAESGSLFVHCDWRLNYVLRCLLNEILGKEMFQCEIIWKRSASKLKALSGKLLTVNDYILHYGKSTSPKYNTVYWPYTEEYKKRFSMKDGHGQYYWAPIGTYSDRRLQELLAQGRVKLPMKPGVMPRIKNYLHEGKGVPPDNVWVDIDAINSQANEDTGYSTQKPLALLERAIQASSDEGDLVLDFFCGSGTTMAVAEKLGRKWIGCDLGRFAIHTSRKRLIGVQRELKKAGKPYRSFEILNLGKYERQWFIGVDPTLPEPEREAQSQAREAQYLDLICQAYKATRTPQHAHFHARRGNTMVVIGPVDAPVTEALVTEALEACLAEGITACDVLGFDWEMGLAPRIQQEGRRQGVEVALKYIPRDVFDKRAVEKGEVQFYDVAYVEAELTVKGRGVTVTLKDFGVFYRQDDLGKLLANLKPGASKVVVDQGKVQKITKRKEGTKGSSEASIIEREDLTKSWTDWIDYWAVDFNYESKQELIRWVDDNGNERQAWTGGFIFENEWQSYRTRKDRSLELTSTRHEYPAGTRGKVKIAIKIIDIFGNDTTKVLEAVLK